MAYVIYGQKGPTLGHNTSYQTYLTLSNYNTIVIRDDSSNPQLTGKPGPANNPGDVTTVKGYLPGSPTGDSRYAEPYYEHIIGTIYLGLGHSLDFGIYQTRADGLDACYEYLLDYYTKNGLLNEDLDAAVDFYDSGSIGTGDDAQLTNFGLKGTEILADVLSDWTKFNDLVDAIMAGEGAANPVAVTWQAADGIVLNLQSVSNVNITDNTTYSSQDSTELDLDASTSSIYSITYTTPGYDVVDAQTSIVNGQFIFSQNTSNSTATIASSIYGVNVTLGTTDTVQFNNIAYGTTIIAGADAAGAGGYTLTVYQNGSTGGISFSSPGAVPGDILPGGKEGHDVGITLPAGILASPKMGLLAAPGYRPDLVIVNSSSSYVDVTTQNEMVFAVGYDDTFNAGPVNATVIDLNTMAAHGQTTPVGGDLNILRKQEPLLSEIEDLLEQISNRDALATLQASPYESQDFPGNAFQLSVFAGNAPSPTITAVNVHTLYGPGVDYAQNLVVSNPDSSNTSDPITFSLPATNDLGVELTNTRGFDLAVYGFANFIQGPSATSIVSQISNFYITPDIQNGGFVGGNITGTKDLSDGINLSGVVLGTGSLQNSTVTLISASTNSFVISGKTGGAITTNNINRISSGLDTLDITDFEGAGKYNSAGHLIGEFFTVTYNGHNVTINSYTKYTQVLGGVALSGANAVVSYNGVSLNISGFASVYLEQQSGGNKKSKSAQNSDANDKNSHNDPIAVALTQTGINITNLESSSTYFDFTNDGLSTLTSWAGPDTGFLVIKSDNAAYGVSVGDGYELLGTGMESGFAVLHGLITNDTGTISASDPAYSELAVWQDTNDDGVAQPSEVSSLAELGISDLSVNTETVNETIGSSVLDERSSVTFGNGEVTEIGEVDLSSNSQFTEVDNSAAPSSISQTLPQVEGYGGLPDLQTAMTADPALLALVEGLVDDTPDTVTGYDQAIQNIMYEWAGVTNVAPSAGVLVDGRMLDFLNDYTGDTGIFGAIYYYLRYTGNSGDTQNLSSAFLPWYPGQAIGLSASWADAFDEIEARLLVQTNAIFGQYFYVPKGTDLLSTKSYYTTVQNIEADEPTDIADQVNYWVQALNVINESVADTVQNGPVDSQGLIAAVGGGIPFFISQDVLDAALSGTLTYFEMSALKNDVSGTTGSDLFDVTESNMTINGLGGGDEIIVNPGVANLKIIEVENNPSNKNVLFFAPGISESDISVSANTDGDIILTYDSFGNQVTLDYMASGPTLGSVQGPFDSQIPLFSTTEYGVQEIVFSDGTTWTAQQLLDMLATTGSPGTTELIGQQGGTETLDSNGYASTVSGQGSADTILYNRSYGNLIIDESNPLGPERSIIQFGSGILASDLVVSSDQSGDLILSFTNSAQQIVVANMANSSWSGVEAVEFADGSSLTAAQLLVLADIGTPWNTSLYGSGEPGTIDPQGYAHSVTENGVADTIVYNQGYGDLVINGADGASVLAFGSSVTEENIAIGQDSNRDVVLTDLISGSTIVLAGMAASGYGPSAVTFSDGTTWSNSQLLNTLNEGSAYNLNLYAYGTGDTLNPNGFVHNIVGNGNYDTILYTLGDGDLNVNVAGSSGFFGGYPINDQLVFGNGISESDVAISANGSGNIVLTVISTGSTIVLDNMLETGQGGIFSGTNYGVSSVSFADGTTWSIQDIINGAETGSPQNTTIYGSPALGQVIDPKGYAHTIDGTGSASIIDYNAGYGPLTVNDGGGPAYTLALGSGVTESEIAVTNRGSAFVINVGTGSDQITLSDIGQLSQIDFADGTTWSPTTLLALADIGSPENETLYSDSGSNIFDPKGYAHTINGGDPGVGSDTIYYDQGYGDLTINEISGNGFNPSGYGTSINGDVLFFGPGISETDVTVGQLVANVFDGFGDLLTSESTYDVVLYIDGGKDKIALTGMLASNLALASDPTQYGVGSVVFSDGTTWTAQQIVDFAEDGNQYNEVLNASVYSNFYSYDGSSSTSTTLGNTTFNTNGYASVINGSGGQDVINYSVGDGDLTINEKNTSYTINWSTDQFSYGAPESVLSFSSGISESDIEVSEDSQGDVVLQIGDSSNEITITGMAETFTLSGFADYSNEGVGSIVFSDGTTWSNAFVVSLASTEADDAGISINGTLTALPGSANNTFNTEGIYHTIDDLSGGTATIIYDKNYGNLSIYENSASANGQAVPQQSVLYFGPGISESDISVSLTLDHANGSLDPIQNLVDDIILTIASTGATIDLQNMGEGPNFGVGSLVFSDGTTWSVAQIFALLETATPSESTLYGPYGNTTFNPNGYAHTIYGTGNSDKILYNQGYGNLTVYESSDGLLPANVLKFGAGIDESDISVSEDAGGDIILTDMSTGSTIDLAGMATNNYSYNNPYFGQYFGGPAVGVGSVVFSDGTTWSRDAVLAMADIGSYTDTTLIGNPGNDYFNPNSFAHSILNSNGGADTIVYDAGYGNLTISETNSNGVEQSVLELGPSISEDDLAISYNQNGAVVVTVVSTGSEIVLNGMAGSENSGVGSFVFSDGTTWSANYILSLAQTGTPYNTTLYGGNLGNSFDPAGFAHVINGGSGTNTILYNEGYGDLTINEDATSGSEQSVLQFGSGISASQISAYGDSSGDIVLDIATLGTQIVLSNMLNDPTSGVGALEFADGGTLNAAQLVEMAETGAPGKSIIYGNAWGDTIITDASTRLVENPGIIKYDLGSGDLVIQDVSDFYLKTYPFGLGGESGYDGGLSDILSFGPGIFRSDISASTPNGLDIVLKIAQTGREITLSQMLLSGKEVNNLGNNSGIYEFAGISEITFDDGTTLTAAQIQSLLNVGSPVNTTLFSHASVDTLDPYGYAHVVDGNGGVDTILYNANYGNLTINESSSSGPEQSVLQIGTSVPVSDIVISGDATGDVVLTDTITGDVIILSGMLDNGRNNVSTGVGCVVFQGAITLSAAQIIAEAETGTPTNTTLYARNGNATFQTGGYAQQIDGNGGADMIDYTAAQNDVQINEQTQKGPEQSVLTFAPGITLADLTITTDGAGDVIVSLGSLGGEIDLTNMLTGTSYGVGSFVFADGLEISAQQIDSIAATTAPGNITLYSTLDSETIDTMGYADYIHGNGGADTIIYNLGYGNLTINEQNPFVPEESVLQFGAGISESDVSVSQDANGDIVVSVGTPASTITLIGMVGSNTFGVAGIDFADGTTWTAAQIIAMTELGSATNTTLTAGPGNNVFDPGGFATVVSGNGGADTIIYDLGYGPVTVNEESQTGPEQSVLQFGAGISISDIAVSQDALGDIILTVGTAGDVVTLSNMINSGQNGISFGVGEALFTDGTTLSAQQLLAMAETGSPTNTVLKAGPGGDTIDPAGFATQVLGGAGKNTILYGSGDGGLTIDEGATGGTEQSVLQFGTGISAADITATYDAVGDIILSDGIAGDQITVSSMLLGKSYGIGKAVFADGTSLTAAQIDSLANPGWSTFQPALASVISGSRGNVVTSDKTAVQPFSTIVITDKNAGPPTESVTVTPSNDPDGSFSDPNAATDGGTIVNGAFTISGSATYVTSVLDDLIFTPLPQQVELGQSITTGFLIKDQNSVGVTSEESTSVTATTPDAAPVITGTEARQAISDEASLTPFSGTSITDIVAGSTDSATITLVNSNGQATDANGVLTGAGLTEVSAGVYTLSADSLASLNSELDAVIFTPTAHQVAPGYRVVTGIDLAVTQNGLTTKDTVTSVYANAVNDAPVITGTQAGQTTLDEAPLNPFSAVVINEPDSGITDSVTITQASEGGYWPNEYGILSGIGLTTTGNGTYTLAAATAAVLTEELNSLTFTPSVFAYSGETFQTNFTLAMSQEGAAAIDSITSVIEQSPPIPQIIGGNSDTVSTDEAVSQPFAGATISGLDPNSPATLIIEVGDLYTDPFWGSYLNPTDDNGSLSGAGLTEIYEGTYILTAASDASLSSELDALVFTPTAHEVAPGQEIDTSFELSVSGFNQYFGDFYTGTEAVFAANDAPTITGTETGLTTTDEAALQPFASAAVNDPDFGVTDSVTITLIDANDLATDANGVLSGVSLTEIGTGNYTLTADTPANLTAELEALTFTPTAQQVVAGGTVVTNMEIDVTQNGLTTTDTTTSVIVTATAGAPNEAPVITGTAAGQATSDEGSLAPFSGTSINDVNAGVVETATITVTNSNGVSTDADGVLAGTGLTEISAGLYTLAAATPASLTAELDALTFTPVAHQVAPGQMVATGFTLSVTQGGLTTTDTTTGVIATAVNDAPAIVGTQADQITTDEATLSPLASVTISDPDIGTTDNATITLTGTNGLLTDADGTLSGTGLTKIGTGIYTLAAATPGNLTTELDALTFTPTAHQVAPGQTVATGFTLAVSQNGATTVSTLASVIATATNDAPTITVTKAGQATSDESSLKAFAGVTISDPDIGVVDSVTITMTGTNGLATDADGTLSGTGLTKIGTGLYTLAAATPGSLTVELDALTFTPTAHQVAPGQTVATGIALAVSQNGATTMSTLAIVIATAANDAPTITGTKAGQATSDEASLNALAGITISDPDTGVMDSATITLTGTNGLATDAHGTLSGTGLTKIGAGLYLLAAATPASLSAELDALTFTPTAHQVAPGQTVTTGITLAISQNGATTVNTLASVIATAANDAPTITGATAGQATSDEASLKALAGVTISDLDIGVTDSATITLTGTNGLATDIDGTLSGIGLTKIGSGLYTLAAATPGSLTVELDALTFTPTAHQVAPGQTVATGIALAVSQNGAMTVNMLASIVATAANDAPTITGTKAGQVTSDEASLKALAGVTISDPDTGVTDSATIKLTGTNGLATDLDGTLSGTGLVKIGTGLYTLSATTPGSLTAALDALVFTPTAHQVAPGQTVTTGLTLAVSQNGATTVNTLASVIAAAANDAPTIAGTKAGQATSDEASLKALASVTISDPDVGVTDSATITLTGTNGLATDLDGILSGSGLTKIGTGLYTLAAAAPGSLTAELDALIFTPTAHQVVPGQTVTTGITLAVSQNGTTTVNALASVIATAVNDTPTITGTKAGQTVTDVTTLAPLSSVSITDPDVGVTETVTLLVTTGGVTATDANGTLSGAGLTKTAVGTYVLSGTPNVVTAELDALIFIPTPHEVPGGQTVTTGIIIVDDQNGAYVTNASTGIIATAVSTAPVVTGLAATQTTTDEAATKPFAPISISGAGTDTATIILTGTNGVATDADGTLSGAGLTKIGTGTYTLAAATAASLTSELTALSFAPTAHQVAPGKTVTTGITLALSQGGSTTIASTSVVATAVNDAPVITGTKAGQTITDQTVTKPFAGVTISDPDTGVTDTVAITLTGTNGLSTDLDGTLSGNGLTKIGTGLYTLAAASPASLTAELESLSFTPTARQVPYGQSVVTGFDLSVTQNGLTTVNTATSVIAIDEEAPTTISNGTLIALQSGLILNTGGTIHAIAGGSFANTIDYNTGYGALTITEATPGTAESSILAFGSGITESEILLHTDSAGDLILTVGSAANQITLTGMAKSTSSGVADITFADGTTWTAAELVELASLQSSTSESDYSLSATTGQKTMTGTGIFILPAGISSSEVAVQSNNVSGNLTVTLLGANGQPTANSITIDNYWWNNQARATLLFANGTTLSLNNQAVETYVGTATQTTLVGSDFAPNIFDLGPGGDQITLGAAYDGGNGQNTIEFGYGDGAVTVNPNEASGDIIFGAGITASDVVFESNDTTGNLTILLLNASGQPTGDSLTIDDYWWTGTSVNLASFANGTTLAINHQLTNTWDGTATDKTLVGSDFTPNVFNPGPGGDQITLGANYDGGNAQNTINFGTGDGIITVTGNQGLADVSLSGTLTLTDVTLSTDASNDILLSLADGTDKLIFTGAKYDDSFEGLTFSNGTTLTESEILNTAETGTTGNDTINAASGAEVIDGRGGNDVVNGGGGYDTYIYREGYGNLTINNAASGGTKPDGELDFGPGITSNDLWFTRSGNNLDIDVLGSKNLVVVDNWFSTPGAQLAEIKAYNGLEIDSGLNQLIAAMAAYNTATPAFNPETATQMPTNTALEAALATAWHG